jgi:hypothetical protein
VVQGIVREELVKRKIMREKRGGWADAMVVPRLAWVEL